MILSILPLFKESVRTRLLVSVSALSLIGFVCVLFVSRWVILEQFKDLETANVRDNIERVHETILREQKALSNSIQDWSTWDQAYDFMVDGNKKFEVEELAEGSTSLLKIDLFIWRRNDGSLRWGKELNSKTPKSSLLKPEIVQYFAERPDLFLQVKEKKVVSGLILIPHLGPSLISILPVLKASAEVPAVGSLIAVRRLDDAFLKRMGEQLKLNISLATAPKTKQIDHFRKIEITSSDEISGSKGMLDLTSSVLFLFRFEHERTIFKQGKRTLLTFMISILLLFGALFGLISLISKRLITDRLENLAKHTSLIKLENESEYLKVTGRDEISQLESNINEFIRQVRHSQKLYKSEQARSVHTSKLAALGEMSAGIAHEINNPLAVIAGGLQLLKRNRSDETKFDSRLESLSKATLRIEKIVRGLQRFGRSIKGSEFRIEPLESILAEVLVFTEAKALRHKTQINVESVSGFSIKCDQVEIEQVFINLVNNSIDAVKKTEERWVKISARSNEEKVIIQVTDSGRGIPLEVQQKLFEPFFTTKPVGQGTGLGLSITKGILDRHDAKISLRSDSDNTCFEVEFPKPTDKKDSNRDGDKRAA